MTHDVYYRFLQSPEQMRRVGTRGGKATAHNRRPCLDGATTEAPEQSGAALQLPIETTAAVIALLDARCPWLRGAEERFSNLRSAEDHVAF